MNPVRTVSATKAAFFQAYPRPITSIYRRVIEEMLVELHLVIVNSQFVYDPFFGLGFVTVYDALMEAYEPADQREPIYVALCKALDMKKPEVLRQDAATLMELLRSGQPQQRLRLLQHHSDVEDVGGIKAILQRMKDPAGYAYSRVLILGLYTAFEVIALDLYPDLEERTRQFIETISTPLGFPAERVKKDLELYRSSLDRMKQARAVVEEMVKAARRQQERRTSSTIPTSSGTDSGSSAPPPVESQP